MPVLRLIALEVADLRGRVEALAPGSTVTVPHTASAFSANCATSQSGATRLSASVQEIQRTP